MAIQVREDTERSTIQQGRDGVIAERAFTVFGIDVVPAHAALWTALQHASIPDTDANDPHPTIPGVNAISKSIAAIDGKNATVMVRYEPPTPENAPGLTGTHGGQTITTDATSTEVDSYFDQLGERYNATYTGGFGTLTSFPRVTLAKSLITWTFTTIESASEVDIALRTEAHVETVNASAINGWPARVWKCDDIQSRPWGQFRQWREVQHVLTYKRDTWDVLVVARTNSKVPDDATAGNGFRRQRGRDESDFSLLPITIPTLPP